MQCILCEDAESRLNEVSCQRCDEWVKALGKRTANQAGKTKDKTIIAEDIERYTGYMEFAYDELVNCHPKDQKKMRDIHNTYYNAICALETLAENLHDYKLREDEPHV